MWPFLFPKVNFWLEWNRNRRWQFFKTVPPGFCIRPMKKPFLSGWLLLARCYGSHGCGVQGTTHKACLLLGNLSIQHLWLCGMLPRVSGKFWLGSAKIFSGYFQWNFQMSSRCKYNWCCQHLHSSSTEDLKTFKVSGLSLSAYKKIF